MNGLIQVQPVINDSGILVGLIGVRGDGNVYYGELTGAPRPSMYSVKWSLIEEKK